MVRGLLLAAVIVIWGSTFDGDMKGREGPLRHGLVNHPRPSRAPRMFLDREGGMSQLVVVQPQVPS